MPSSTNWEKNQPSIYLALVLGPYPHGGTYLLIMTNNIGLFLSNHHIRRHMCLVLSPIDLNLAGHQKHTQNMYQRD